MMMNEKEKKKEGDNNIADNENWQEMPYLSSLPEGPEAPEGFAPKTVRNLEFFI
jgi:hypothetical protein